MQQQIPGPERKYPRKTFASGGDGAPNTVVNELLEMQQYIDYSVFSRNQLRFAEKVFNTNTYKKHENHLRGKNMFLKLNKPQYWNKTNVYLLCDSIEMVLNITREILEEVISMKSNSNSNVMTLGQNLAQVVNSITNYFTALRSMINQENDLIQGMTKATEPTVILNYFLSCKGTTISGPRILALGIVLSIYAKVVSILSYVNPYVQVRKDSGVDSIKAPKILYDAIIMPEGTRRTYSGKSIYEGFEVNNTNGTFDETVHKIQRKTLNPHITTETGTRTSTTKTYSKNPIIRLKQHPMYALDIIFPIKIAPYIITKGDDFIQFYNYISPYIIAVKLICSVLKISFDGVLSKFHTINQNSYRIKPSYSLKYVNGERKMTVKLYNTSNKINQQYYQDVLDYSTNRAYFEGKLQYTKDGGEFSILLTKLPASGNVDVNVDQEAMAKQIKSNTKYNDYIDGNYVISNPNKLIYYNTEQNAKEPEIKQEASQNSQQNEIKMEPEIKIENEDFDF